MIPFRQVILGLLLSSSWASAQDVPSGPDKGSELPALRVWDVTGPNQGKEVDYKAERKEKPTVYLFIPADKWDRPMARFMRKLDEATQNDAFIVAVWLGEAEKSKEYLPLAQKSLQLQATALTCFVGDRAGPTGWNVNSDAHLTAVVARNAKVSAVFGYRSINETNVPAVIDALKKAE